MVVKWNHRLSGSLVYFYSLSKALPMGYALFNEYPSLNILMLPTLPILYLEKLIPFGSLILFFVLFFGLVQNINVSYFIRLNTLQSILLYISIIVITFSTQIFLIPFISYKLLQIIFSCIFILILSISIFCIYECFSGREPNLPIISNAAKIKL